MLRNTLAITLLLLSSFAAFAQSRYTADFDADWRFLKADAPGAEQTSFDDSTWRKLDVPHDWSIEGPFDPKNPTGGAGGFLPAGIGWYRKHFTVTPQQIAKRVFIDFDGVMANSDVWINGFHLGKRPYGYVSFEYELTGHLNASGDNVIAVRADNSGQPASRWYTGAGIYRHVRLVTTEAVHFANWGTFVTTPKIEAKQASVHITTEITNQSSTSRDVTFAVDILDPQGKKIASTESAKTFIAPGQTNNTLAVDLSVKNPQLWDIGKGILYKAVVRIKGAEARVSARAVSKRNILDEQTLNFGIREFHFEPATGFWINGRNVKLKGMCLHHDGSAFGAAVPLAMWERRLNELRTLGTNAIRNSHNPAGDFLDLADRMGFVVMDELFDQWTLAKNPYDYHLYFNEWAKTDVRDTVRRDRNHPSVIIYSAGNEIRDNHADQEKAKATLRGLVDTFHENDPTRPVTQALFRPNIEGADDYHNGLADILDVVGQNYREKEILAAYAQKPTRKIIGTENDRQSMEQWLAFRDHPEYSGQFIWAGVDYLGETRAWPNYAFSYGMLDRTGYKRPLAWQRQSWWADAPMVYIARRTAPNTAAPTDPGYDPNEQKRTQVVFNDWTPANLAPHPENVEVYSNCDSVELFLNGRSLGTKAKDPNDRPRNWMVTFEPGTVRAVCVGSPHVSKGSSLFATTTTATGGNPTVRERANETAYELRTAGAPAAVKLTVDKTRLTTDWNDVVFVTATIVDANGVPVPMANNLVSFSLNTPPYKGGVSDALGGRGGSPSGGNATVRERAEIKNIASIVAVDSADNADHDPFQSNQRHAFQSRVLAYIKATGSGKGTVIITATSDGLKAAGITLNVVK